MHYQVRFWDTTMDGLYSINGENVIGGRASKLVSPMASAASNGQGIDMGIGNKLCCLLRVCKHLLMGEFACCANAIFFTGFPRFKGS